MSVLPFGKCLWWLLPKAHVWNRIAAKEMGEQARSTWASHPYHVTIQTQVGTRETTPGFMALPITMVLEDHIRMTCTEFGDNERFYALEAPLSFVSESKEVSLPGIEMPHLSLGYRLNDAFRPTELEEATKVLTAMRRASECWDADASNVVLINCEKPIQDWTEQVNLLKRHKN